MLAAVLSSLNRPLELQETPDPCIGPDDVLVKTRACGICRTDLHIQDGLAYVPALPHIPGHEPAGVVAEVGERVAGFSIGDAVTPHLFLTCETCRYCRTGRDAQCQNVRGILGVTTAGGFAEFFVAPAKNLLRIPAEVPFELAGLTSCAVVTAVHAFRRARVSVGDTVVVLGVGGIGLMLIQLLRSAGAHVIGVSRSERSLELGLAAGAHECFCVTDPELSARTRTASDGLGAACVFECVGAAATMRAAADCAMRGGQIVVIGEEADYPAIDTIQIAQRELEIIGSRNGSKQDAADALALMAQRVIRPVVAQKVPLAEINAGLAAVRDGCAHGRVVVTMS